MARWEERKLADCGLRYAALNACGSVGLAEKWCPLGTFDKPPIERWNEGAHGIGSQNFRPSKAAIAGDAHTLAEVARVWRREGWFGREIGSETYSPSVITSLVIGLGECERMQSRAVARSDAAQQRLEEDTAAIRWALRATWFMLALLAHPRAMKSGQAALGQSALAPVTGNCAEKRGESGPTCIMVGERQNAGGVTQKTLGHMLAYAVSLPVRRMPSFGGTQFEWPIEPPDDHGILRLRNARGVPRTVPKEQWAPSWQSQVETFCAAALWLPQREPHPYGASIPWTHFGLEAGDVQVLRDGIEKRRPDAVRRLAFELGKMGVHLWRGYKDGIHVVIVCGPDPEVCVWIDHSTNGNKPSWPMAAMRPGGRYEVYQPTRWRRSGATAPGVDYTGDVVIATADGNHCRMVLPPASLGNLGQRIEVQVGQSVQVMEDDQIEPPEIVRPPDIPAPPPPPHKPGNFCDRIRGWWDR